MHQFSTLQRPTLEELERRRAMRSGVSPMRATTLNRKESFLRGDQRGLRGGYTDGDMYRPTGLQRADSMYSRMGSDDPPLRPAPTLVRKESILKRGLNALRRRESMLSPKRSSSGPPLSASAGSGMIGPIGSDRIAPSPNRRIGRATSFKYPERVSQIPPPEITRIRSKSQVREIGDPPTPIHSSLSYLDIHDMTPMSGYGHAAQWLAREKVMLARERRAEEIAAKMRQEQILRAKFLGRDVSEPMRRRQMPVPPAEKPPAYLFGTPLTGPPPFKAPPSPVKGGGGTSGSSGIGSSHQDSQDDSYVFDAEQPTLTMVSRRKILSRSRDDLNLDDPPAVQAEEEDVWYQKEKLYKDHIREVLGKWESIDDEIWAKVIVLERNRRVAKAYARAPVLTVNGSEDGFDGFRIGVNGFDNPMRDHKVTEFKDQIGLGCKVKMDEMGNILIKRFSKSGIFIKNTIEENSVSNDILKLPNGLLEFEKPFKLFDMKKFQQNVNREMKRQVPDRRKLECQCISTVAFVKNEIELLDSPIWVMLINVVALEMLKAKLPTVSVPRGSQVRSGSGRPLFPQSGSSDEDPYSLTPSGSSGSSGKGQNRFEERLPNREKEYYGPQNWAKTQRPDFSDDMDEENTLSKKPNSRLKNRKTEDKRKSNKTVDTSGDDPYYCGLRARVPNFVQNKQQSNKTPKSNAPSKNIPPVRSTPNLAQLPGAHPFWWHSRLYPESELSSYHGVSRMGRSAPYRSSQFTAPPLTPNGAHRPGVFRTGWE